MPDAKKMAVEYSERAAMIRPQLGPAIGLFCVVWKGKDQTSGQDPVTIAA